MDSAHVCLRIGREAYAVPAAAVIEIVDIVRVIPVPRAQPSLLGITPVRARLLPLLDFASLLGVQRSDSGARAIVVKAMGTLVAFAVDAVTDVVSLPGRLQKGESDLVEGVAIFGGEFVGVLSLERVLDRATEAYSDD